MAGFTPTSWEDLQSDAGFGLPASQKAQLGATIAAEQNRGSQIAGEMKTSRSEFTPTSWGDIFPHLVEQPKPKAIEGGIKTTDFLKSGAAGALSGAGMIAQGGGELLARGINFVGDKLDFDPQARAVNPLQGWINALADSRTPAAKKAEAESQISGELMKPETWSFGADPSASGIALQGVNAIGQFAPNLMLGLITAGASIPVQLATGAVVGGIQALGGSLEQEREAIQKMTHDELMAGSTLYAKFIESRMPKQQAKDAVAEAAAIGGGLGNAIPSAAEGAFENFLIGALTKGKIRLPSLGAGMAGRVATGVAGGAAMGGTEEAVEQAGQNIGSNVAIGGGRSIGADTLQQFVMGAIAEGTAGGGFGMLPSGKGAQAPQNAPQAVPVAPGPTAPVAPSAPAGGPPAPAPVDTIPTQAGRDLPLQFPGAKTYTALPQSAEVAPPEAPPGLAIGEYQAPVLSPIDQARVDAQVLKSSQDLPGADDTRMKNATLLSIYGENAAVRHVISDPDRFAALGDAMFMAAPAVEKARAAIAGNPVHQEVTDDIFGAIDELERIKTGGLSVAEVLAEGATHDLSHEAIQLVQFFDEHAGNPKRLAAMLENILHEVEMAGGIPSKVRGNAFQMFEARMAEKKAAKEKLAEEDLKKKERQKEHEENRMGNQAKATAKAEESNKREKLSLQNVEKAIKLAGQNPRGINETQKAYKARLEALNAKQKPSPEDGGTIQGAPPSSPKAGPGQNEAGERKGPVPKPAAAGEQGNARSVGAGGNQPGAQNAVEGAVNRGAAIAAELKPAKAEPEDWLKALFVEGPVGEKAPAAPGHRIDVARLLPAVNQVRADITRQLAEWKNKQYKGNRQQVQFEGDGPARNESMSIGTINESRKRRTIEALSSSLVSANQISDVLENGGQGAERLARAIEETWNKAHKLAADEPALYKDAGALFEELLLRDVIKVGGVAKGAITSNPVSKMLRAQLEQGPNRGAQIAAELKPVDVAAHEAAASPKNELPQPTKAQILAGNATLGHPTIGGLDISIESPEGSTREDKAHKPPRWSRKIKDAHYGYVKGVPARAPDKDHVDIFVKPGTAEDYNGQVYVIDQNRKDGRFDEPKVMIGYSSGKEAIAAYLANYEDGWITRIRNVTGMSMEEFKSRLQDEEAFLSPQPVERSPAQLANDAKLGRRAKNRKIIDQNHDTLLEAIAKKGGINIAERNQIMGDKSGNHMVPFVGYVFSANGIGLDDMATWLAQDFYMTPEEMADVDGGVAALMEKVRDDMDRAIVGTPQVHFSASREQLSMEQEMRDRQEQNEAAEIEAAAEVAGLPDDPEVIAKIAYMADVLAKISPERMFELDEQYGHLPDAEFEAILIKEAENADQRPVQENLGGGEGGGGEAQAEQRRQAYNPNQQGLDFAAPAPSAVAKQKSKEDFEAHIAAVKAREQAKVDAIGEVGDYAIMRNEKGDRWQAVLPDTSGGNFWRTQSFDANGFSGHMVYNSKVEAIRNAAQDGYYTRDDGALDRLQDTPGFKRGLAAADIIRRANGKSISWEQAHKELAALGDAVKPEERPSLDLVAASPTKLQAEADAAEAAAKDKAKDDTAAAETEKQAKIDAEIKSRQSIAADNFALEGPVAGGKKAQQQADIRSAEHQMQGGDMFNQPATRYGDQTDTAEFDRWFGDSKVVDAEGKPLVVYHGTTRAFSAFDQSAPRSTAIFPGGVGMYFTKFSEDSGAYSGRGAGANIMPVYVRMVNPFRIARDSSSFEHVLVTSKRRAELEAQGYDGIIFNDGDEIVAFHPTQIKSAIGNTGAFDPNNPSIIEQRKQAYNPDQLELIYDHVETRPGTTAVQREAGIAAMRALFLGDRRAGATLLGSALWKDFQERAGSELIGKQAGSAQELALAAQILRDPRFETLRVFFTKGNTIVGHTGWTSRLPGAVAFSVDSSVATRRVRADQTPIGANLRMALLKHEMDLAGADGWYMMHNHPSGHATPSASDRGLTAQVAKQIPGFKGHIVIDHGQYATIDRYGDVEIKTIPLPRQPARELRHDALGYLVQSPGSLVEVGKLLTDGKKGYATLIVTNGTGHVQALAEIPEAMLLQSKDPIGRGRAIIRIRKFMNQTGSAGGAFLVAEDPARYDWLIQNGSLTDIVDPYGSNSSRASIGITATKAKQSHGRSVKIVLAAQQMVWHGTPHVWPPEPGFPHGRPRLDKIGTGEGAQVYGWGFYTAQAEGVGGAYQKLDDFLALNSIGDDWYVVRAHDASQRLAGPFETEGEARRTLDTMSQGSLYRLDIPEDVLPKLLDWDRPLSEQSESVRAALAGWVKETGTVGVGGNTRKLAQSATGAEIYHALVAHEQSDHGPSSLTGDYVYSRQEAASRYLNSIGIPGNRYLDQGSRAGMQVQKTGDMWAVSSKDSGGIVAGGFATKAAAEASEAYRGTFNYVIWDQRVLDRIALLERNGEKLDAMRGAEFSRFKVEQPKTPYTVTASQAFDKAKGTFSEKLDVAKQAGYRNVARNIVDRVDQALNPLGTLPEQRDYLVKRYLAQGLIEKADESAKGINQAFDKATEADKQAIYEYFVNAGAKSDGIKDVVIRKAAEQIKADIGRIGDELVEHGLLAQESRDAYKDAYLPRLYLKHLLSEQDWKALGAGKKPSDMGYLKARKDIPLEVRKVILGEITDPGFLAGIAIAKPARDMALLDWLGQISKNQNWILPGTVVDFTSPLTGKTSTVTPFWLKEEAARLRKQARYYAPENATKAETEAKAMDNVADDALEGIQGEHSDYKAIPNTARYGRLRGMLVRTEIHADLMGINDFLPTDPGWFQSVFGYGGVGTKATQIWKGMKVSMNPPAQVRNFVSNGIAMQLFGGVPLRLVPARVFQAFDEIRNNGKHYAIAKEFGVGSSTFATQEVYRMKTELLDLELKTRGMGALGRLHRIAAFLMNKSSDMYQLMETVGKTGVIIDAMERQKMSKEDAVLLANHALFDYSLVQKSLRYARAAPIGVPFATYAVKVLPRLIETALLHPQRFIPWVGLFYGFPMLVAALLDVDKDDLDKLKKAMHEWLQDKGHALILPWKDENNRWQVYDAGYTMPWGSWTQLGGNLAGGEWGKALQTAGIFGGPITDIIIAIKTGKDPFTGRDIIAKGDPPGRQAVSLVNYVWNMGAPPFLTDRGLLSPMGLLDTAYGGKMVQALTGTTNKYGEPRATEKQALLYLAGINVQAITPEFTRAQNLKTMQRELHDVKTQMMYKLYDQSLTPEQKQDVAKEYATELVRRASKMQKYAKESEIAPALQR